MVDQEFLSDLALKAGKAILEVYAGDFSVELKEDDSPLTLADRRSHEIIRDALLRRYPDIPLLSEEGKEVPYDVRRNWRRFWLVDPLDGTKEFVKRNDEFTVNIALVQDGVPIFGVIHIPALKLLYLGGEGEGAWEIREGRRRALSVREKVVQSPVRILSSRSHASPNLGAILELFPSHEAIVKGSALKFCAVASGEADFYPRLGPTWEWDTAAGQAIVVASGGVVVDLKGGPFRYNKPNLVNGPFLVAGSLDWLNETGVLGRTESLEPA